MSLPTQTENPFCKCRVLYLGTTYYKPFKYDNNLKVNLNLLQSSIASRYPTNGEKYAKGIETWFSIYPSGLQMEHSVTRNSSRIDGVFLYPIRSLIYCAALRYSSLNQRLKTNNWKFIPLDSEEAEFSINLKNPPIFVAVTRNIEPTSRTESIECHVFVVGMKKTAMRLVESCQKVYSTSTYTTNEFIRAYGTVPAVFTLNDKNLDRNSLTALRKHDNDGFFYVLDASSIDVWQLYESEQDDFNDDVTIKFKEEESEIASHPPSPPPPPIYTDEVVYEGHRRRLVDPYEDAPNLVRVEKTVDPNTGQNIYVRWLAPSRERTPVHIIERERQRTPSPQPPIVVREREPTPRPIVVEKIIQRKKPQLIIKEIHVNEPAPPPIKVVKEIETDSNDSIPPPKHPYKDAMRPPHYKYSRHHHYRNYPDYINTVPPPPPQQRNGYYDTPDYYSKRKHSSSKRHYYEQSKPRRTPSSYQQGEIPSRRPPPSTHDIPVSAHYHHEHRRHHHHHRHRNPKNSPYDLIDDIEKILNSPTRMPDTTQKTSDGKHRKVYVIHDNVNESRHRQTPRKHGRKIIVIDESSASEGEDGKKRENGNEPTATEQNADKNENNNNGSTVIQNNFEQPSTVRTPSPPQKQYSTNINVPNTIGQNVYYNQSPQNQPQPQPQQQQHRHYQHYRHHQRNPQPTPQPAHHSQHHYNRQSYHPQHHQYVSNGSNVRRPVNLHPNGMRSNYVHTLR